MKDDPHPRRFFRQVDVPPPQANTRVVAVQQFTAGRLFLRADRVPEIFLEAICANIAAIKQRSL